MNRRYRKLGLCYPGYRYCGPGCSGPGEPTNPVDVCCKFHDDCYSKYGSTKLCDELFLKCLSPKITTNNKMGRDAALFYNVIRFRNNFF